MALNNPTLLRVMNIILQSWDKDGKSLLITSLDHSGACARTITLIECRLLLIKAMTGTVWEHDVRVPTPQQQVSINQLMLVGCNLSLNTVIVEWCSVMQPSVVQGFPFFDVMRKLLVEKIKLTTNPLMKSIYIAALKGAETGVKQPVTAPLMYPQELQKEVFCLYAMYGAMLQWVDFSGWEIPKFSLEWYVEHEPCVFVLLSYAFMSENKVKNINIMLKKISEALKIWPNLHNMHNAITHVYSRLEVVWHSQS